MKTTYKGCEIEVFRDQCLGGWEMLFFSVFDGNYEVTSGFSESSDTVREFIKDLKELVDDYREHPEEYLN
jgi:hypothetical protein